jgi:hypothetical protein
VPGRPHGSCPHPLSGASRLGRLHPKRIQSYVRTELLEPFYDNQPDPQAARAALEKQHPLEPAEVASLATWLASDEAGFASGQPYIIDGALTAGRTFEWAPHSPSGLRVGRAQALQLGAQQRTLASWW